MASAIELAFHSAMLGIYKRAKSEAGYNATRFLSMVTESGGLETARTLLHKSNVSEGYAMLWELGRLDLTVEALMLEPEWCNLFTDAERAIAIRRLRQYEYAGTLPHRPHTAT